MLGAVDGFGLEAGKGNEEGQPSSSVLAGGGGGREGSVKNFLEGKVYREKVFEPFLGHKPLDLRRPPSPPSEGRTSDGFFVLLGGGGGGGGASIEPPKVGGSIGQGHLSVTMKCVVDDHFPRSKRSNNFACVAAVPKTRHCSDPKLTVFSFSESWGYLQAIPGGGGGGSWPNGPCGQSRPSIHQSSLLWWSVCSYLHAF